MTESTDPVLRQRFLEGMSHTAATVNVVTTDGVAGRAGVTVSAMSSVSADTPRPSLLVCVHHLSNAAELIVKNKTFCVNVLHDHQSHISDTFASRRKTADGDKFSCAQWTTQQTGSPRIIDPLVAFDCTITSAERVGTHHVFIGEVVDVFTADHGSPLIFANRAYGSPARINAVSPDPAISTQPLANLSVGCFHTFGPFVMPALLSKMRKQHASTSTRVIEGDQRTVLASLLSGESELGLLYDMELGDDIEFENLASVQPYVLLPEGHALAEKSVLCAEDLTQVPLVLLDAPPSRNYFLSIFETEGLQPNIAHTSSSLEMVRGLVGHGLGYSLLATKPASSMSYDGKALVTRPLQTRVTSSRLVLARRKNTKPSLAAQQFSACCSDCFPHRYAKAEQITGLSDQQAL